MSNARTGLAAAVGAIFGGAVGAAAGRYAALNRPRLRYTTGEARRSRGQAVEDAMVIGGGVGATFGAFLGGTIAGEDAPPKQLTGK